MPNMKYTVKDSVFTFLFKLSEYAHQLYLTLHPNDKEVKEEDCKIITLENILTTDIYNDLGLLVRDKLILLVEAQSTFSLNIVLRLFLYLAMTYQEYVDLHTLDLYSTKPVVIPRPELYVVYTGDKKVPEILRLSDLYEGLGDAELTVHVLQYKGTHSIIDQYISFCKIADEQRKKHGYTKRAVEETIRICIEQDILVPFLRSREKEVHDIMTTLFSQERLMQIHDYRIGQEKKEEGLNEGIEKGICALINSLRSLAIDKETALQQIVNQFELSEELAKEKIEQYWK